LFLSGGGQFGLGAHSGMIRYLEEQKRGFDWGGGVRVPIVPGAVIDDLALGDPTIRPDPQAAYRACEAASAKPVAEGNVGAGAGATVGRMLRRHTAGGMKGGLGTASLRLGDIVIAALAVVNAAGDVLDWRKGQIVAGARKADGRGFADVVDVLKRSIATPGGGDGLVGDPALRSTTLIVVATNLTLTKTELTKFKNLLRDPRCSVLVSHADWWSGFLVFEGKAELTHSANTDAETLRLARRHIFSATTRRRSADWDQYDRIAAADRRVAMVLRPDHIYGSALARMREALAK